MLNELKNVCKGEPHLKVPATPVDRVAFNENFDSADCRRRIGAEFSPVIFFLRNLRELEKKTLISL